MKRTIFILLVLAITSLPATLTAQLSVDAQLRNRFEVRNGYLQLAQQGDVPSVHVSQRTRAIFSYKTDDLRLTITPQDVRVWGDEPGLTFSGNTGKDASLDLYEAFAEIKVSEIAWLSVGRQRFVYDNQSLLSDGDWAQRPGADDAVVVKLSPASWKIHAAGSWNSLAATGRNNLFPTNKFKTFNFVWANRKFDNGLNLSLVHVSAGVTQTDTTNALNFRHTSGFFTSLQNESWDLKGNAYYQYGRNQAGRPLSAVLIDADLGYRVNPKLTSGVGLGYLSGNSRLGAEQETDNLFDPLYRTRHGFFGFLDYFRVFPTHTNQGGLLNLYIFASYRASERLSILYRGHYFQLAQSNASTPSDKYLGIENDFVVRYNLRSWAHLEGGYSFIIPSATFKTLQGVNEGDFSQFLYVQLNLTPNLFKQTP